MEEVFNILQETQRYITDNKELKKKSEELETAGVKLREVNEELTKLDKLKDEFISTVTHEMRTPITSIRALSEIINDNEDLETAERAKFLDTIVEETKRMERLINQVLDLEKMESGKLEIPFSTIHLNDVVTESVRKVKQLITEKGIILNTNLHGKLPLDKGNRDRLVQVILNLVSNAIKFCDSSNGEITITTSARNGSVELSVSDNGPGVPNDSQKLIFEAFYQARNQTLKKPEGTGLGLTICKKIIDKHQGSIWIENGKESGAVVAFSLPKLKL